MKTNTKNFIDFYNINNKENNNNDYVNNFIESLYEQKKHICKYLENLNTYNSFNSIEDSFTEFLIYIKEKWIDYIKDYLLVEWYDYSSWFKIKNVSFIYKMYLSYSNLKKNQVLLVDTTNINNNDESSIFDKIEEKCDSTFYTKQKLEKKFLFKYIYDSFNKKDYKILTEYLNYINNTNNTKWVKWLYITSYLNIWKRLWLSAEGVRLNFNKIKTKLNTILKDFYF